MLNKENLNISLNPDQIKWVAKKQTAALEDIAIANTVCVLNNKSLINLVPAHTLIKIARNSLTGHMRRASNIEHHAYFSKVLPIIKDECQAEFDRLKPLMEHTDVNLWLTPDKGAGQSDYDDSNSLIAAIKEIVKFDPDAYFTWFAKIVDMDRKADYLTLHWRALSQLPEFLGRITPAMEMVAFLNPESRRYLNSSNNYDYAWKCISDSDVGQVELFKPQFPKLISYVEMVRAYLEDTSVITIDQIKVIISRISSFKCPSTLNICGTVKWEVLEFLMAKVPKTDLKTFKLSVLEAGNYEARVQLLKTDITDCIPLLSDNWLDYKLEEISECHLSNQPALLEKALKSREESTYVKVCRLVNKPSLEIVAEAVIRGDAEPCLSYLKTEELVVLERFCQLVSNKAAHASVMADLNGRQTRKSELKENIDCR